MSFLPLSKSKVFSAVAAPAGWVPLRLLVWAFFLGCALPAQAALFGTRTIGPTGNYLSIGAAIADVQTQGLAGPLVLELQPAYASGVESFPLVFTNLPTTAANTLTVRPQSGATGLVISSGDTSAATVDLNGAQYVTFDGRPGGVGSNSGSGGGTVSQLTLANTALTGITLRFINGASNNTAEYLAIQGVNNKVAGAVVLFSGTATANGNSNNSIDHCDIHDGATTPLHNIYAVGTTTTQAQFNSGETITNCNIYNFHTSNGSQGVELMDGNTSWTISGNSFYQTATRPAEASAVYAININSTGTGFVVNGNFIGGDSPGAAVTTQPWTTTGTSFSSSFHGMYMNVGISPPCSIQGNTIRNMVWTTGATSSAWTGIEVNGASANIGTVTGNVIGSPTGTGSITMTTAGSGGTVTGIVSGSDNTVAIANNSFGSITANGTSNTITASIIGIQALSGNRTIANNLIGSLTDANSLNAATASTSSTKGQQVIGILISNAFNTSITGNIIANLNNNYAGTSTAGQVGGILAVSAANTITGNTIRNLTTASQNAGILGSASALGISQSDTAQGQTISRNIVQAISNTAASANVTVTGIYYSGASSGTNAIADNLVDGLALASASASSVMNGMYFNSGTFTAQNNMVRIGVDDSGVSTAGQSSVAGINDNGTTAVRNYYHNSVYVGGTEPLGANNTFAFTSAGVSNARAIRNNIFVNARGKSGGAGKNYAVNYGGTTVHPTGLTAGNNLFFANGTGGVLGLYNGADVTTLPAWQSATGVDAGSLNADPLFGNPTGTAATVDLHLQSASPARMAGALGTGVTDDIDGDTRSASAPDIGADEFRFPNDANLTALILSAGTLSPAFATGTPLYTVTVSNGTGTLLFTPTKSSAQATVTVNGNNPATPVALSVGTNTVTITVTAHDGTMNVYQVTVTRQTGFPAWAAAHNVSSDPTVNGSNGLENLINFAFGVDPNSGTGSALVYTGTFAGGGTLTATGQAITRREGNDVRVLFVRRDDYVTAGLSYTVSFSGNLTSWQNSTDTPTVLADDGSNQIVSVPYPAGTSTAGFSKVSLNLP